MLFDALSGRRHKLTNDQIRQRCRKPAKFCNTIPPKADIAERFIPGFDFAPSVGMYARAGTPQPLLDKIAAVVAEIAKEPEIGKQFATTGIEAGGMGPAEYAAALKRESERVAATVKAAGMTPQ
jgi:tripartite-type tricarboxylate transporter receptor subunit TctC